MFYIILKYVTKIRCIFYNLCNKDLPNYLALQEKQKYIYFDFFLFIKIIDVCVTQ